MSAAEAFWSFEPQARAASTAQARWQPADGPMPTLFISHGAPPLFEDGPWMDDLFAWSHGLPKPTGIVIVSAHWEQAPIAVSSAVAATPLVYDFGGFDPVYFTMTYATPDATALADRIRGLLPNTGVQDTTRGLDHGAWVPLKVMYPLGDVPVIQISMPTDDPERLMALGARLAELRAEGVLIIGSGFMTHGLPYLTSAQIHQGRVPGWSSDFDAWASDALQRGDVETLANFRSAAPGMPYAHPTVEHFSPLFVTLGAATAPDAGVQERVGGYMWGLSRRSFQMN